MNIEPEQQELLEQHLRLVIEANKTTNITRIATWGQGMLLHVEDSLMGVDEVAEAPEGPLADLGSGAGYPGIPLAITTSRAITLVESVGKKAALLAEFSRELGLDDRITVYSGRAEALAREQRGRFSVVTARALSSLPSLMELAAPLLCIGGRLVCYKSQGIKEEVETARMLERKLGLSLVGLRDAVLSDGETPRTIVAFAKKSEAEVPLPRREGKAQKSPYKG